MNRRGVDMPLIQMGAVSSDDLFEPREQVVFDFYERNRGRYKRALDAGANVGIHSIIMAFQGWDVLSFEPDPEHYARLVENLARNKVTDRVLTFPFALAAEPGSVDFVRVLGNGTASHIAGKREHHGEVQRIKVHAVGCAAYFASVDFAKVDVEGMEAELLTTIDSDVDVDLMVEIGSEKNAHEIFCHFAAMGRSMWSEKIGWGVVRCLADMPTHYKQGSLFVGEEWR